MTIDPDFTADTEIRLLKIEESLAEIWRMMKMLMTKDQFNRLNVIRQAEWDRVNTRLDEKDTEVADLEEKYNNLL